MATDILVDCSTSDMETCHKFRRIEAARNLNLPARGCELGPEIVVSLPNLRCPICEVPISYRARSPEQGRKLTWQHGVEPHFKLAEVRARGSVVRRHQASTVMDNQARGRLTDTA